MQTKVVVALMTLALTLTGCSVYKARCGNPNGCWTGYFKHTNCGVYIESPCERYCDACTYNEPSCKVCLDCVNNDGCGYHTTEVCSGPKQTTYLRYK